MKYGVILVDPPWHFVSYDKKDTVATLKADKPYSTMGEAALADMPIADFAAKDCAMFMWVVDAHLEQALELGKAWGFEYKTIVFVWGKQTVKGNLHCGMGLWTRKGAEICLLFTRGKPRRKSGGVRQFFLEPTREHSRKPDKYSEIEALVDGPYLEVFARQRWPGWDQIGDETSKYVANG